MATPSTAAAGDPSGELRGQPPRAGGPHGRQRWLLLAAALLAAVAGGLVIAFALSGSKPRGGSAETAGLDVLPFPGTPDASTQAQVTFPALRPSQLRRVTVQGSSSGMHAGQLIALPDNRGTAFSTSRPFSAGETVSVNAALTSPAAGTASGAPNATQLSFKFTVASPGADGAGAAIPPGARPTTQSFHSASDLHPPTVAVSGVNPDVDSGDIFLDAQASPQNGPMILDSQGRLIWFQPIPKGETATDVRVQSYQGRPVLTWWQGKLVAGRGVAGEDMILNTSYQTVATVRPGEGYPADLHEFLITPQGTALVTAFQTVKADLSSIGGPRDGSLLDSIVQEIDIKTGRMLWEWHALGHVPLSRTEAGKPAAGVPFDFFHINSIQQLPNGNLLVSARNTWAIYEISRRTGKVVWQLGGKDPSFQMGPGTEFSWQHDARLRADGTLTLFDDADSPPEEKQSRAIRLNLNTKTMRATLARSYTHNPPLLASSQGNLQVLPDGNVFVGWGKEPSFSEYTPSGQQIFSASFSGAAQSYRAYRFSWPGQPTTRPSASVTVKAGGALTVYASWNGATQVTRWRLLAGSSPSKLSPIAQTPRSGFETAISATSSQPSLAVQALDSSGHVLGTSAALHR